MVTSATPRLLVALRVVLGGDRAGLLVKVANGFDIGASAERLVEMHRAAAGHQKNVLDTLVRDKSDYIIGEFLHALKGSSFTGLHRGEKNGIDGFAHDAI